MADNSEHPHKWAGFPAALIFAGLIGVGMALWVTSRIEDTNEAVQKIIIQEQQHQEQMKIVLKNEGQLARDRLHILQNQRAILLEQKELHDTQTRIDAEVQSLLNNRR